MSTPSLFKLKEEFQNQDFCLSHFSCLVNLSHVTRVEWDTLTLGTQANLFPPAAVFSRLYGRYVESLK